MGKAKEIRRPSSQVHETVSVSVPLGSHTTNGHATQVRVHDQIHLASMTMRQRVAMAYILRDLHESHATLNGKHVDDQASAVRWLLDAFADAYGIV